MPPYSPEFNPTERLWKYLNSPSILYTRFFKRRLSKRCSPKPDVPGRGTGRPQECGSQRVTDGRTRLSIVLCEALSGVGLFCIVPAAIERDRSGASS